jgi:apolipoprotein N-acyltransferase
LKTPGSEPISRNFSSWNSSNAWRFFPALTGLLCISIFPRIDMGYIAWIAFIPLIAFVSRIRSIKGAFWGGFVAGVIELFALLVWIPAVLIHHGGLSSLLAWIVYALLIAVLSCYPAAACGLAKFVIRRGGDVFILVFPSIWILFEYAQNFSPFGGLPWLQAGYSQSRFLNIIQIADLTGIYGISFLLVWTSTAIFWLFRKKGHGISAWAPAGSAIVLIIAGLIYGKASLNSWEKITPRFQVAMLQGNLSFDDPWNMLRDKFQQGYVRMADRLNPKDLLVIPESPSPVYFESDSGYREMLEQLARRYALGVVFNNVRHVESEGGEKYFNSAYFMDRHGVLKGVYDKIHLVPFGEYTPLINVFSFVKVITKDVGAFDAGSDHRIVKIGDHPANAIICFEAVFPELVRRFVQNGSELIVNLTNDGWYGDSAAPYQHLVIARLRAVENRRYFIRATNSGISALIEPSGRIQSSTGILQEAVCEGRFDFIAARTFYTRYGDVFVFLCAIISCVSVVYAGLRKHRINHRSV